MNAGAYVTGSQLKRLGEYYAKAIHDVYGDDFDVLFGPAYKGIPLAVVTAIAYHELYGKEVKYCCDRKEAKDHGADKGNLLGYEPKDGDRVIMVEDVTTSGKSIDETYPKVKAAADVEIKGLIVSLNRQEVGKGGVKCACDEVSEKYGFPTAAIVTMEEVTEYLSGKGVLDEAMQTAIAEYYKHGVPNESGVDLYAQIASENSTVVCGQMWSSGVETRDEQYGVKTGYAIPEIGVPYAVEGVAIVNGTKNEEEAQRFVNWFGSAQIQGEWAETFSTLPANTNAVGKANEFNQTIAELPAQQIDWALVAQNIDAWCEKIMLEYMP